MLKRIVVTALIVAILSSAMTAVATTRASNFWELVPPIVLNIQQEVPVTVTIQHPDDPSRTIEFPLVLSLDQKISVTSPLATAVEVGDVDEPLVDIDLPYAGESCIPEGPGRIVFSSERSSNEDVYIMDADGSNVTQITTDDADYFSPSWSPDGCYIAFNSQRSGNNDIYIMDADGSNVTQITTADANDRFPTWSPDGRYIAFDSLRGGNRDIYVIGVDGKDERQITTDYAADWFPTWSPDGRYIAFNSQRSENDDIYVIGVDGKDERRITTDDADDYTPSWSPDGRYIAFNSDRAGNFDVYIMDADGSNVTQITTDEAFNWGSSWSPDGRYIAFNSQRSGNGDIYVIGVDGKNERRITTDKANDRSPLWSPLPGSVHVSIDLPATSEESDTTEHPSSRSSSLQIVVTTPLTSGRTASKAYLIVIIDGPVRRAVTKKDVDTGIPVTVSFDDIPDGQYTITARYESKKMVKPITVEGNTVVDDFVMT